LLGGGCKHRNAGVGIAGVGNNRIGTALAAKAELVVTGEKPMLTVAEHQGVRIIGVAQAIKDIEATGKA
jgi:predicted nucleic acid-binding protein